MIRYNSLSPDGFTEFRSETDWRTGKPLPSWYERFIDEILPKLSRGILLVLTGTMTLAGLIISKISLFAIGDHYRSSEGSSRQEEIKDLRVATFWAMFAPAALQLLYVFFVYMMTATPNKSRAGGRDKNDISQKRKLYSAYLIVS